MLGALAFAGVGGANNLVQSNWIRDKGFGMGAHIPHVVSPITGEDQAKPSTGYMVRQDEENLDRFWGWWRVANKEQFFVFFCIGLTTIIVFSLLAYSTVYGKDVGEDLDFIQGEGDILATTVGPWFRTLFWVIGAVSLFGGLPRAARLHRAAVGRRDQDDPRAREHEVDREQALLLLRLDRDRARHGASC